MATLFDHSQDGSRLTSNEYSWSWNQRVLAAATATSIKTTIAFIVVVVDDKNDQNDKVVETINFMLASGMQPS